MKRRMLLLLLPVLAFATMGQESCDTTTTSGGGGDEPQVEKNAKKGSGKGKGSKPDRPDAKVGDRLTLKGTSYLVSRSRLRASSVTPTSAVRGPTGAS